MFAQSSGEQTNGLGADERQQVCKQEEHKIDRCLPMSSLSPLVFYYSGGGRVCATGPLQPLGRHWAGSSLAGQLPVAGCGPLGSSSSRSSSSSLLLLLLSLSLLSTLLSNGLSFNRPANGPSRTSPSPLSSCRRPGRQVVGARLRKSHAH